MRILLDCRPLINDPRGGDRDHIIISCVNALADQQGVEWLILVDRSWRESMLPGISRHRLLVRSAFPGNAGWRIWYDWQIPGIAKKYKPDLLMTTGGLSTAYTDKPQCVWMPGMADPAKWTGKKGYAGIYRKRMARTLREAGAIFSFSEKDKDFLERSQGRGHMEALDKIVVVNGAPDSRYGQMPAEEREGLKSGYALGKEYFLVIVTDTRPAGLVDLLKAFSGFKKRQRSNMQLVLARTGPGGGIVFPDRKLDTYKYRPDVHIYDDFPEQELHRLVAASYAFVAPFGGEGPGLSILNAWKAGVPVITTVAACLPEMAGDTVLYALPEDPVSLAGQLMLLFKDEGVRSGLIGKGLSRVRQ
ncbi:MAG TPA: glycosyltransferase, partial [Puia sp.]|nr:glycosyltransferase [Puia sp.]